MSSCSESEILSPTWNDNLKWKRWWAWNLNAWDWVMSNTSRHIENRLRGGGGGGSGGAPVMADSCGPPARRQAFRPAQPAGRVTGSWRGPRPVVPGRRAAGAIRCWMPTGFVRLLWRSPVTSACEFLLSGPRRSSSPAPAYGARQHASPAVRSPAVAAAGDTRSKDRRPLSCRTGAPFSEIGSQSPPGRLRLCHGTIAGLGAQHTGCRYRVIENAAVVSGPGRAGCLRLRGGGEERGREPRWRGRFIALRGGLHLARDRQKMAGDTARCRPLLAILPRSLRH